MSFSEQSNKMNGRLRFVGRWTSLCNFLLVVRWSGAGDSAHDNLTRADKGPLHIVLPQFLQLSEAEATRLFQQSLPTMSSHSLPTTCPMTPTIEQLAQSALMEVPPVSKSWALDPFKLKLDLWAMACNWPPVHFCEFPPNPLQDAGESGRGST